MTDTWFIQDIEKQISHRDRVVVIDPVARCEFLLSALERSNYTILRTDPQFHEEWERVREELFLRYEAESKHKNEKVIFYVTRPKNQLSFLFDYCYTHGCVDLSSPAEWLRKKLFSHTGIQVNMENPMLLTAAKMGMGKDLAWWKKILQNLEDLISIDSELLPFLADPDTYLNTKEPDVKRLFEEKLFELIGQPYMAKPPATLAKEVAALLFNRLLNNDISPELLNIYYKWLDSNIYAPSLKKYVDEHKLDPQLNIWNVHHNHCFGAIDHLQLKQIAAHFRDASFVRDKLQKIKPRVESRRVSNYVPRWWHDLITLFEFDNKALSACNSLEKVIEFYTSSFHKADRAIRNLYAAFIHEESTLRPLQEHYESLNHELLQHWFDHASEYKSNQQGYLANLLKQSKPGIAVIVGDGVRFEIASFVADQFEKKANIEMGMMLADMPSETEHNMSALYAGGDKIIPIHKDREKQLSEISGKNITYLNLEALHYGIQADYLVLTYKDVDSAGEKLQMGAIKLFSEFESVLTEKIQLLLNMNFKEVHMVTDHGFVLTGLLDDADKIDPVVTGQKEVKERFIRTAEIQKNNDWLKFDVPYGEYRYVYTAKSQRPFKSKGLYGFAHGGFTPQEIIIPNLKLTKIKASASGLGVIFENKKELSDITGDLFVIRIDAPLAPTDVFSRERKVQIKLYADHVEYQSSDVITMHPNSTVEKEFSFHQKNEVSAVLVDAVTQEQLDSVIIKKSSARDLGGLL